MLHNSVQMSDSEDTYYVMVAARISRLQSNFYTYRSSGQEFYEALNYVCVHA